MSGKKKISHGVLSDFAYVFMEAWRGRRLYAVVRILYMFAAAIEVLLYPFISKYAMEIITVPSLREVNISIFSGLLLTELAVNIFDKRFRNYINYVGATNFNFIFIKKLIKKRMSMDYQNMEDTSVTDSFQKAMNAGTQVISSCMNTIQNTFINGVSVIVYTAVLSTLSPFMILAAGVPALVCFLINYHVNGWVRRNTDKWVAADRQCKYLAYASGDFGYAKDVRIYNMAHWIMDKYNEAWKTRLYWYKKNDEIDTVWRVILNLINYLSLFFSYAITIYYVYKGNVGAGDFVLYFGSISNYGNAIWNLADNFSGFFLLRDNINFYRDYLEIPDKFNHGDGEKLPDGEYEIEFKNVSYTYPKAENPTIKNISFKLHNGEKIALVGLNGAGKTTLIKLMCGLYDPTEGEILLNGTDIRKFNRDEYYTLFSTVFQDFDILPITIAQNITQRRDVDYDGMLCGDVDKVLKKAGLYEKIKGLKNGADTLLAKSVFDEATDFSGGEMQKLALAKALYKNAPMLLLDEPTAALDPISERQMYMQYAKFSRGKASVFISHRLASTRFCDNIIFMENGRIAEQGTHAELMEKQGKYAELFEIQSEYYKEKKEA